MGCAKCINVYRDAAAMGNLLFVSRSAQPASSTTTQFDSLHSRALLMLNTLLSLSYIHWHLIIILLLPSAKAQSLCTKLVLRWTNKELEGGKVLSYLFGLERRSSC